MAPSQSELLRNAVALDQKLNKGKVSPANAPAKLLFPPDDDPFGGNENNRRAAGKAEEVVKLPRANEDDDQKSNLAALSPDQTWPHAAFKTEASEQPVNAPVAPVAAPLTKAQKAAAKKAAAQSGVPTWNGN